MNQQQKTELSNEIEAVRDSLDDDFGNHILTDDTDSNFNKACDYAAEAICKRHKIAGYSNFLEVRKYLRYSCGPVETLVKKLNIWQVEN